MSASFKQLHLSLADIFLFALQIKNKGCWSREAAGWSLNRRVCVQALADTLYWAKNLTFTVPLST